MPPRRFVTLVILFSAIFGCYGDTIISLPPEQFPIQFPPYGSSSPTPPPPSGTSVAPTQTTRSPVGTWQVSATRTASRTKETGTLFVTFNTNNTFTGYGITTLSLAVITLSGTWNLNASGEIVGSYTENLNGTLIDGSLVGKASAGKALELSIVASNGTFKLNGKPALLDNIPDFTGSWDGLVTEEHVTVAETYTITVLDGSPGIFEITGNGNGPNGPFTISGAAVETTKGQLTGFAFSDFQEGGSDTTYLTGKFNPLKQTVSLSGIDANNLRVRAKLSRP